MQKSFPTKQKYSLGPCPANLSNSVPEFSRAQTRLTEFLSFDLGYSQTEELQQLDFLPQLLEFSDSSFIFFPFIIYFRINNNNCYHCLSITDIKQHEKMCLLPGLEFYFSLYIKAL